MKVRIFVFCFLFFIQFAEAQVDDQVQYIGIEQGLSNNAVTSIFQDHNGFMWFGTYDGLNLYDGYSFKIFRNIIGDNFSIGDNHISTIDGDESHGLWVGCERGVYVFNPMNAKFSHPQFKPWNSSTPQPINEHVPVIRCIKGGKILLGVANKGLIVFEKNSQTGTQVSLSGSIDPGNYSVSSIDYDAARQVAWVAVPGVGLCQYDLNKNSLRVINNSMREFECLKLDSRGNLWMGNETGLFRYNIETANYSRNLLPDHYKVIQLFEDKHSNLWIASDGAGVWSMSLDSLKPKPFASSNGSSLINSNAVYSIYEDKQERKWVGTLRGGINLIQPHNSSFKNIVYHTPGQNSLINNFILSFCEDEHSNLWIGTDGAGLRYWDRTQNRYKQFTHDPSNEHSISSNFITGLFKDTQSDLWVSTWFGGVNRLKKGSGKFEHFSCFNPNTNSTENNAWLVFQDAEKKIWASTTNNGTLYCFNGAANRFEVFDPNIQNLQCLAEDRENNFWGGNYTSLIRIDRVYKKHFVYKIGYTVRCIHEGRNKNFWVGTDGGGLLLFNRSTGTFKRFTTAEGLPSNSILRILEDDQGNLWLSTYNGLCKFNTISKTCRSYSQSDGLQSNQFSFNAALALSTGEFLFGGIKGFNIFYPDSVYDKKEIPQVFLTGLKINNTPVEENDAYVTSRDFEQIKQVRLPYDQAILSLDFVGLEYSGADKLKYAYKLEGWDKNWNYVSQSRTANYSRLQEGSYSFKIKVTNSDGLWSPETSLLQIIVLPPWYRTWWAYLLYPLVFFGGIYLYLVYNKQQERLKYEVKLAHLENEKEKEITEKKISFFTHISHEFRTPLTLIINPLRDMVFAKKQDKEDRDLRMVYRNARRLLSLVDQLLLFRKVESVDQQLRIEKFDIAEACHEVYLSFGQHALSKNIDFEFDRGEHEVWTYGDKEKIEIILFNLVSNAFKYTGHGGKIVLSLTENAQQISIRVKDTGVGIPASTGNKLFESFYQAGNMDKASQSGFGIGLYVSQKLAAAHSGTLNYASKPGEGTEFCLTLQKGKSYFSSYPISEHNPPENNSTILQELVEDAETIEPSSQEQMVQNRSGVIDKLRSELPVMLVIDDHADIRSYIGKIFRESFVVYEAEDGYDGYEMALKLAPNIIISDVMMQNVGGVELCQKVKTDPRIAHIPIILLTASSSDDIKLKGIEGGAEDYITKPFDKEIISAKVQNILKGRNRLQQYFFNAVTLKPTMNINGEHKDFIERCIAIVEDQLDNPEFTVQSFCRSIGMSHPSLYKKVKSISGLTVNVFIRYIRLGKAAELLITTDKTVTEITYLTGFNDIRYFREQFFELFKMNPSDYVKRYRKVLGNKQASS
ncbi:MAG: two-component regulator propeller domain-containing protein [Flavisolibacter sp.]